MNCSSLVLLKIENNRSVLANFYFELFESRKVSKYEKNIRNVVKTTISFYLTYYLWILFLTVKHIKRLTVTNSFYSYFHSFVEKSN